jgi:hypothetical protein
MARTMRTHILRDGTRRAYCGAHGNTHWFTDPAITDRELLDRGAAMVRCEYCMRAYRIERNRLLKGRKWPTDRDDWWMNLYHKVLKRAA